MVDVKLLEDRSSVVMCCMAAHAAGSDPCQQGPVRQGQQRKAQHSWRQQSILTACWTRHWGAGRTFSRLAPR